ncbi:hypothetical protein C9426_33730 [Serratia sp. S1B]|nr:hypothetical protein C9426_33730 [Serratia sp. S1B]
MRFLGKFLEENAFWWFAIGVPVVLWGALMGFRLAIYTMQLIQANAWDQRREAVILQETRRGRRALQILAAECSTAHLADVQFITMTDSLLRNEHKLVSQRSWKGENGVRHSRLPAAEGLALEAQISAAFADLLKSFATPLSALSSEMSVNVLLESSCSLPPARVQEIWQQAWLESQIKRSTQFVTGSGMAVIDYWLDHHINEKAVLLVVALQIAPEQPEMTAEAVVGLLLGNRLTQHVLMPIALLHRPESSGAKAEALQETVLQALDWVPLLPPGSLQHLWLVGLFGQTETYQSVVIAQSQEPLVSIDLNSGVHNFDEFLGDPGSAGPWLAIAAAAQVISHSPAPHMVISGDTGSESDTVWCTVVAPTASHKENQA